MKIIEHGRDLQVINLTSFDLEQTLECGQCFHFEKIDDHEYAIVAKNRLLHAFQDETGVIFYETTRQDFEDVWKNYFDLERDYDRIKEELASLDERLSIPVEKMWGVRILNQDFFETLMSFIISQNKQIPHIKQIVFAISKEYGENVGKLNEKEYFSFPECSKLRKMASEDDFRRLKAGFRAPYLMDAINKVSLGIIDEERMRKTDMSRCMAELMMIKGVGEKVANCVSLFALGHREAFPVDVWIKRMMEQMYFDGKDTKKDVIERFATKHFKELGGYAQQYIFYYGRNESLKKI